MSDPGSVSAEKQRQAVNLWPFGAGLGLFVLLFAVGSAVGGEPGQIMAASVNTLPFAVLAVLAYLGGERPNWAWVATGLWLALMVGGVSLIALGLSASVLSGGRLTETERLPLLGPAELARLGLVMLGIAGSIAIGALFILPAARRLLARIVPINPASFVHAVALIAVVTIGLVAIVPLVVLGAPPFLTLVDNLAGNAGGRDAAGLLRDQIYSLIWTIPAAILAVGFGITRDLRGALARLGLTRPTPRQALIGLGLALLLAGAAQALGAAIEWLWGLMGWPVTDEEAFEQLFAFAINPVGALVIGISAGLGEELAMRGVLQPRLGLWLSNFFFTSLHAFQYNWDALLIVFLVGVACGIVRQRSSTSVAAIVHGGYNFTLIMLVALGVGK
ncbi:MAG: CPBP family glutamic-type intramembrane protease [Oscillochloridaceae bacterium]|nr:CPBP family glutamic-type intramembrane protease [Chloroflexaceae bacterium]MDW8390054.1 CPBP family glutamic-type intramembrane protease [Oscillochloridaceae bacterium]